MYYQNKRPETDKPFERERKRLNMIFFFFLN